MSSPLLFNSPNISFQSHRQGLSESPEALSPMQAPQNIIFMGVSVSRISLNLGEKLSDTAKAFKDTQPDPVKYHQSPALFKPLGQAGR